MTRTTICALAACAAGLCAAAGEVFRLDADAMAAAGVTVATDARNVRSGVFASGYGTRVVTEMPAALAGDAAFTVGVWAKAPDNPGATGEGALVSWGVTNTPRGQVTLRFTAGGTKLFLAHFDHDFAIDPPADRHDFADGAWHHYALTYAAGTRALYFDGREVWRKKTASALAVPAAGGVLAVGAHIGNFRRADRHFTGRLADVRVFDTALTAAEVEALRAATRPRPGTVGGKEAATVARPAPAWLTARAIYQINMRAFTPEGTLKAAAEKLPHIASTGAGTVYLCPIFTANVTTNRTLWSPRQKKSGFADAVSNYCMNDYFHTDPEYGTDADLKAFIARAHALGLKVMFDLVYAHCSQFVTFVKDHPDWVVTNADGTPKISPWASLTVNFKSPALREYLMANVLYWMAEFGVDAFRCDVADAIPIDFWEEVRARAERLNPEVAFLAEGDRPVDEVKAFDCCYGFGMCNVALPKIMDGKASASYYREYWENFLKHRPEGFRVLGFFDSHDVSNDDYENRRERRWGHDACDLAMALNFTFGGVPFVYNGQEIAEMARHSIFGKAPLDWSAAGTAAGARRLELVRALARLRAAEPALQTGARVWLANDRPEAVVSFARAAADGRRLAVTVNLSPKPVTVRVTPPAGAAFAAAALLGRGAAVTDGVFTCAPWAFDVRVCE